MWLKCYIIWSAFRPLWAELACLKLKRLFLLKSATSQLSNALWIIFITSKVMNVREFKNCVFTAILSLFDCSFDLLPSFKFQNGLKKPEGTFSEWFQNHFPESFPEWDSRIELMFHGLDGKYNYNDSGLAYDFSAWYHSHAYKSGAQRFRCVGLQKCAPRESLRRAPVESVLACADCAP